MTTDSPPTDQHTADAAGGESIFSSDGLAPLPIPPPPAFFYSKSKPQIGDDTDNDGQPAIDTCCVLDSETADPMQAFEIFQGRMFAPRAVESGGITSGTGSTSNRTTATAESTMMRLARIERELNELESECSRSLERRRAADGDTSENEMDETDGAVRNVVDQLSKRLAQLQGGSLGGSTSGGGIPSLATRQNDLTSLVRKEMNKLAQNVSTSSANEGGGAPSQKEGSGSVVYELYDDGDGDGSTSHRSSTATISEQEERLNRIEAFLGSSTTSASAYRVDSSHGHSSLLERLTQAEETLKSVDMNVLDNAAARAKVIRADLEAAAKARNKISSSANPEDTKIISELHSTLLDLDSFLSSNTLSIIVQRLQACAALHGKAAEFHNGLTGLEHTVGDVEGVLRSVEENLGRLEVGMVENMEVVKRNMEVLDGKFGGGK